MADSGELALQGYQAQEQLSNVLRRFDPALEMRGGTADSGADVVASFPATGELRFQVKYVSDGAPGAVRNWLVHRSSPVQPSTYLVLSAPYLSERAMDVCEAFGVGALDLVGNYRLAFGPYRLERVGNPPPPREHRELRNLYSGKTLRVVRAFLAAPHGQWGVQDLARACDVSLGTVSGARQKLVKDGWLEVGSRGASVIDPEGLLRQWAESARAPGDPSRSAYTTLHGARLIDVLTAIRAPHLVLGGASAAEWMAPFLTVKSTLLYADLADWRLAAPALRAEEVDKGGNLTVQFVADDGVFLDRMEAKAGLWTASPTQTFVDLWRQGGRSREAAEKLLHNYLHPLWQGARPYAAWPLRDQSGGDR